MQSECEGFFSFITDILFNVLEANFTQTHNHRAPNRVILHSLQQIIYIINM